MHYRIENESGSRKIVFFLDSLRHPEQLQYDINLCLEELGESKTGGATHILEGVKDREIARAKSFPELLRKVRTVEDVRYMIKNESGTIKSISRPRQLGEINRRRRPIHQFMEKLEESETGGAIHILGGENCEIARANSAPELFRKVLEIGIVEDGDFIAFNPINPKARM